jgi:tetratricopeptide (TPR) repeat protein
MPSATNRYRIGDLAIELKLITSDNLQKALFIAGDTGLPLGRVLVLSGVLSENDMTNLIRCQSLLRENLVQFRQVFQAMSRVKNSKLLVDEALYDCGWDPSSQKALTPLGELLVASNVITEQQLQAYLRQQSKTKLPLGRMLISAGVITDQFLNAALNLQILVRDKKLTKNQAKETLLETRSRMNLDESTQGVKAFYDQPPRSVPKIGELLVLSGSLSESKLIEALELSLLTHKAIGQVLIEKGLVTKYELESALLVQSRMVSSEINVQQAKAVLSAVHSGKTLTEALGALSRPTEDTMLKAHFSLLEFLKSLHCTDDSEVARAFEIAKRNSQITRSMLLMAGSIDEKTMNLAQECHELYLNKELSFEQSCTVFEFAKGRDISLDTALAELRWTRNSSKQTNSRVTNSSVTNSSVSNPAVTDASVTNPAGSAALSEKNSASSCELQTAEILESLRKQAQNLVDARDYESARTVLEQLIEELSYSKDHRYSFCLEQIARVCCELNDFAAAEKYSLELLEIQRFVHGADSITSAQVLNSLGKIYYFLKRYDQAIKHTKLYIKISTNKLGKNHPDVACGWQNLAMLYYTKGEFMGARSAYEIAVGICQESLGPNHPTSLSLAAKLASIPLFDSALLEPASLSDINNFHQAARISGTWRSITLSPSVSPRQFARDAKGR